MHSWRSERATVRLDEHRIEQPDHKRPSRADGMVALPKAT
jgi:hypothetical protein